MRLFKTEGPQVPGQRPRARGILHVALAAGLLVALGTGVVRAQAMRSVPRISIDEVKALMAKKQVLLVDVRDAQSFTEGHIPGAVNILFDHIPYHADDLKTEKRLIVTYCA